jgi:biotin carboxylase
LINPKSDTLKKFQKNAETYKEFFPQTLLIKKSRSLHEKITAVQEFMHKNNLHYPLVIKPDLGFSGIGISMIKDTEQMKQCMAKIDDDYLLQEYIVRSRELSIFYIRHP